MNLTKLLQVVFAQELLNLDLRYPIQSRNSTEIFRSLRCHHFTPRFKWEQKFHSGKLCKSFRDDRPLRRAPSHESILDVLVEPH